MIPDRGAEQRAQVAAPTRRTALIIWSALVAGVAMFAIVGTVVGPEVRRNGAAPELLVWVSLGLTVVTFILSRIVPGRMRPVSGGASPDAMGVSRTIVAAALNEGAALFAIVVWMVGGFVVVLVPLTVSAVGLLLAFPSETRWTALTTDPDQPRRPGMVR
jgi:hypothetical protein